MVILRNLTIPKNINGIESINIFVNMNEILNDIHLFLIIIKLSKIKKKTLEESFSIFMKL